LALFFLQGYSGQTCREDNRFLLTLPVKDVNEFINKNLELIAFTCAVIFIMVTIIALWLRHRMNKSKKQNKNTESTGLNLLDNKNDVT